VPGGVLRTGGSQQIRSLTGRSGIARLAVSHRARRYVAFAVVSATLKWDTSMAWRRIRHPRTSSGHAGCATFDVGTRSVGLGSAELRANSTPHRRVRNHWANGSRRLMPSRANLPIWRLMPLLI
jgi:hypothetical protein